MKIANFCDIGRNKAKIGKRMMTGVPTFAKNRIDDEDI
jgi:hypothetical protein